MSSGSLVDVEHDISENMRTIMIGFASFTILVWDHIITFADEVEFIWKRSSGPLKYLFLLNRYLTPLAFIVNLSAYLSPVWTQEICAHFVRYEGAQTMIGVEVVGLMMLLRVWAMYKDQKWVVGIAVSVLCIETCVNAWLLAHAIPVVHTNAVHSCTMVFEPRLKIVASASAWLPLLYDTLVLLLTLWRTLPSIRHKEAGHILWKLFEDGLLYYSVIFSVTLVLTIMIIAAPIGLKNITAQLELLLTVTMMSRITLSLKKTGSINYNNSVVKRDLGRIQPAPFAPHLRAPAHGHIQMSTFTFEVPGQPSEHTGTVISFGSVSRIRVFEDIAPTSGGGASIPTESPPASRPDRAADLECGGGWV